MKVLLPDLAFNRVRWEAVSFKAGRQEQAIRTGLNRPPSAGLPMKRFWLVAVALLMGCASSALVGFNHTPRLEGRVTDLANVLSPQQRERFTTLLSRYEKETSHQIAVLTVPSLSGETIESFSLRTSNAWGLGQRGVDNGILVVLAMAEHRVRIEVGYGFERHISNDRAKEIIQTLMVPAFRKADYGSGLEAGLHALMVDGRRFIVPVKGSKPR